MDRWPINAPGLCFQSPVTGSRLMLGKQNLDATSLSAPPMLSMFSCTPALLNSFFFQFFFFRSLVDTVYALKDEVKELKQVIWVGLFVLGVE